MSRNPEALSHEAAASRRRSLPLALLVSLRPKQWTKNGLLFLALIFARALGHPDLVVRASLAFVDFCLLASATYLINDLMDLEQDRQHPTKRKRPIASGQVSSRLAAGTAAILLVAALALSATLGAAFALSALLYVALTVSYSLWLKHLVILDVLAVASGFVLRAAAGAVVIAVPISPWLYVVTMLGALFLSIGKRRHELVLLQDSAVHHRPILEEYNLPLLDQMMSVVTSATVIAYSLYSFSAENLPENGAMMLTVPFLLYGIFRYLYLIHTKGVGGSPEELLLSDRHLLATILGWGALSVVILYFVR
ncbi:MAG: decaprenyl-phosphate phosphoribosyltransferase [Chloroflexota bacterium]